MIDLSHCHLIVQSVLCSPRLDLFMFSIRARRKDPADFAIDAIPHLKFMTWKSNCVVRDPSKKLIAKPYSPESIRDG